MEVDPSLLVNITLSILLSVAFRPPETVWKEDFAPNTNASSYGVQDTEQKSFIRKEDFRASVRHAQGSPTLDSETGWTGQLWSKTTPINWKPRSNFSW